MPQAFGNGPDCVDRSEWCRRLDESDSTHFSIIFFAAEAVLSLLDHSCAILEVTLLAWPPRLFVPLLREIKIQFPHPVIARLCICQLVVIRPADFCYEVVCKDVIIPVLVRKHRDLPVPAISLLLLPAPLIVLLNSHSSCRSEKGNDCFDHSGRLVV